MNVYIWEYVDVLTRNYHGGGGLVVVATEPPTNWEIKNWSGETQETVALPPPDHTYPLSPLYDYEPLMVVFPDAGCC